MIQYLNLKIVLILTMGFGFASILGYLSHRAKLSPILGYLIAGYLIGPHSPGYVADKEIAEQLAEIGIILMMFSVGLHFKWKDLLKVKKIAIPGAISQTAIATVLSTVLIYSLGWGLEAGIVFGFAIGVASTIVLVRVLFDNDLLKTSQGHVSIGWLIVEDILTVGALLLIPPLAVSCHGEKFPIDSLLFSFALTLIEFILLAAVMFTIGKRIVSFLISKVMNTKTHELFTLTILAITFVIATGSSLLLGTSLALGAFIAGMVISQSQVNIHQQVSTNAMPLRDAFVVIFFLSVGMLFNPATIVDHFLLFISVLGIILIIKPLAAFFITFMLKYPFKTALTISFGLAQIGEFSFILAEQAVKFNVFPTEGYDVIVACALVSISINPVLFKFLKKLDRHPA